MTKKLLFIILPLIALLSYSCQNKKNTQVPASDKSGVIFDTDLGSDIDDVFALQMIYLITPIKGNTICSESPSAKTFPE
ncbi:hypothetical protein [Bacteroides thetaiotaomicron]|uniref:hypothetical protein n=1 Tax=Bacteroides thetaiotaomicron TaxID=818 RepID=UPI00189F24E4|nr:hypothetical protein [Bacteroides thetaiotaomicron]